LCVESGLLRDKDKKSVDFYFKVIDTDNTDNITFDELKVFFQKQREVRSGKRTQGHALNPPRTEAGMSVSSEMLSEQEAKVARAIFEMFDEDKSGQIDRSELKLLFKTMQLPMDSFTLTQYVNNTMKEMDKDMTLNLEFEEFMMLFTNIMKNQHPT